MTEVAEIFKKLKINELILLYLAYHYSAGVKREDIERFIRYYKPGRSSSTIGVHLSELLRKGFIKRVKRGYYAITVQGLRKVRWYWLSGRLPLPRERLPLAVDKVRCKVRKKKEDGSFEIVYI